MRLALAPLVLALAGCGAAATTASSTVNPADLPAGFVQFSSTVSMRLEGNYVVVSTSDLPNHKSPYWGAGSANYEAPQAGMAPNPSSIAAQTYVLRIPRTPTPSASPADTPMDAIGVALNGVVFFNQYAAGRVALGPEIVSFDRYNGHPAPRNNYHYHFEPVYLTQASQSALMGFILDGYPIYGPKETNGSTASGLDACNGHAHATAEYPGGTYHYHAVGAPPYLVGCFHGVAGTVTN
ncbi:MAG: YHYH protein [Gemmatimonadetes bacterium]|nr:YHYH protein [Gemmatimonadota bacterium]